MGRLGKHGLEVMRSDAIGHEQKENKRSNCSQEQAGEQASKSF